MGAQRRERRVQLGEGSKKKGQLSGTEKNKLVEEEGEAFPSRESSTHKAPGPRRRGASGTNSHHSGGRWSRVGEARPEPAQPSTPNSTRESEQPLEGRESSKVKIRPPLLKEHAGVAWKTGWLGATCRGQRATPGESVFSGPAQAPQ